MFRTIAIFYSILLAPFVLSRVLHVSEKGLARIVPDYLFIFAVYYDPYCTGPHDLVNFENAERISEETNVSQSYDIRFAKVDLKNSDLFVKNYSPCSSLRFELWKYGDLIPYGTEGPGGNWVLDPQQKSTQGMFQWLEKQTRSTVSVLVSEEQVIQFVTQNEFTILGYFKEFSGQRHRHRFYKAAEALKNYNIAEVRNHSLVMMAYGRDTIVLNQAFGAKKLLLYEDQDMADPTRIIGFVKGHATEDGPLLHLEGASGGLARLDKVIAESLFVFVVFYNEFCRLPEAFEFVGEITAKNGLMYYLNLKLVAVDVQNVPRKDLLKYQVEPCSEFTNMHIHPNMTRFYRYGKMIKYGEYHNTSSSPAPGPGPLNLQTLEGMVAWLEENSKPAARIVLSKKEFILIVEYNQVAVMGYFLEGSRSRREFHRAASSLREFVWGEVFLKEMNPYDQDTVILYQEFGDSKSILTGNSANLTRPTILNFVKSSAASVPLPVPTRLTPAPPTLPAPSELESDQFYQNTSQIAIFDRIGFQGSRILLDLSGCVNIPPDWSINTWSIKTYGQCVDLFEKSGCPIPAAAATRDNLTDREVSTTFRLEAEESLFHRDLSGVKPENGFESVQFCPKESDSYGVSVAASIMGRIPVLYVCLGCFVLIAKYET